MIALPVAAATHPNTRQGLFLGLGLARGSSAANFDGETSDRLGGWGGNFRIGYVVHPKFALGLESNSWLHAEEGSIVTLHTVGLAASVFPVEGLALRAGFGGGAAAGAGDGLGGEVGSGWMLGAAYEFRVARTFAIGPQVDYNHVGLEYVDFNFFNIGLAMNWYFIPD